MRPEFLILPAGLAGETCASLLEFNQYMADWKQITARIHRARTGKDPAAQLTNLFSKTRDAMVAFELARYFESSGNNADAGRWYLTAAGRFRRADWKTKAQESATRLGATEPAEIPAPPPRSNSPAAASPETIPEAVPSEVASEEAPVAPPLADATESFTPSESLPRVTTTPNRQRRGRRGGREPRTSRRGPQPSVTRDAGTATSFSRTAFDERSAQPLTIPPVESTLETPAPVSLRGRYGDPGLASRLTQLEMNFRRLLACAPTTLDVADKAPAGPGVWVLTDSDLTTYYYVEACQTLRVAIPNLLRSGSSRRGESIKPQLAEHLGIPESRVAKYLADHCVVRWLQLDDEASYFAHFLIAVLHPELNE